MRWTGLAAAMGLMLGLAVTPAHAVVEVSGLKPASPQPAAETLKPGLAVEYLNIFIRHVDEIEIAGKGKRGEPIEALDWPNSDQEVLTSSYTEGVAARITGFLRFPQAGTYVMTMNSNDGIRLIVGEQVIADDPDVHKDRYSEYAHVKVETPGWYPLYLLYFQRKGTNTLELYWQKPGEEVFDYVPAEAFAHTGS